MKSLLLLTLALGAVWSAPRAGAVTPVVISGGISGQVSHTYGGAGEFSTDELNLDFDFSAQPTFFGTTQAQFVIQAPAGEAFLFSVPNGVLDATVGIQLINTEFDPQNATVQTIDAGSMTFTFAQGSSADVINGPRNVSLEGGNDSLDLLFQQSPTSTIEVTSITLTFNYSSTNVANTPIPDLGEPFGVQHLLFNYVANSDVGPLLTLVAIPEPATGSLLAGSLLLLGGLRLRPRRGVASSPAG